MASAKDRLWARARQEPDLKVVGQCSSSAEALALLEGSVDMELLDVDLGEERALSFVEAARKQNCEGRILVVTAGIGGAEAVRQIQAGVAGIVHKRHSGKAICETIRKVVAGEPYLEEKYLPSLMRSVDDALRRPIPALYDSPADRARGGGVRYGYSIFLTLIVHVRST
ncbi:MAG TPA: response regulator [Bryobacteraceae bacterium]